MNLTTIQTLSKGTKCKGNLNIVTLKVNNKGEKSLTVFDAYFKDTIRQSYNLDLDMGNIKLEMIEQSTQWSYNLMQEVDRELASMFNTYLRIQGIKIHSGDDTIQYKILDTGYKRYKMKIPTRQVNFLSTVDSIKLIRSEKLRRKKIRNIIKSMTTKEILALCILEDLGVNNNLKRRNNPNLYIAPYLEINLEKLLQWKNTTKQ